MKFLKNLRYLLKHNLKKESQKFITKEELNLILDGIKYELADDLKNLKMPNIKSSEETISELINKKASFCRFGDGEFMLMNGEDIPFQKYDEKLSRKLSEIFQSNDPNIFIGIPYPWYNSIYNLRDYIKNFIRSFVAKNRDKLTALCNPAQQYYDAACTQNYAAYKQLDFVTYFNGIKKIWLDRDIVIICGKTVFDKIKVNIFDCAKSVEYQYAPSMNAFAEYDKILNQAKKIDKSKLVIIILGPTATVLAYDLAKQGYEAIDFGHIAKDYDFYRKKIDHTDQEFEDFFKPD